MTEREELPQVRKKYLWRRLIGLWVALVLLVGLVALVILPFSKHTAQDVGGVDLAIVIGTIFALAFCIGGVIGWRAMGELQQAAQPVPSPAEISWRLGQEWGRPATLQEVFYVQQMLAHERNEKLLRAGATVGAIYSANQGAQGKRIL